MDDYKEEKSMFLECEGAYDDLYDDRDLKYGTSRILSEKLIFNKAAVDSGKRIIRALEREKVQNRRDFEKLQKKHLKDKKVLMANIESYRHKNDELRKRIKPDKKKGLWDLFGSSRGDVPSSRSYRDETSRSRSSRDEPRSYREESTRRRSYRDEPSSRRYDESSSRYVDEPSGSSSSRYDRESPSRSSRGSGSGRGSGYQRASSSRSSRDDRRSSHDREVRDERDESPHDYRRSSRNDSSRYRDDDRSGRSRNYSPRGSRYADSDRRGTSKSSRQQPRQDDYDDEY